MKGERGVLFNVMECEGCRQDAIKIKPEYAHFNMEQWRELCEAQFTDIKQQVIQ
jgi:hypothetical protein